MSDIDKVKQLRKSTGAGFKDCNSALEESNGDLDKAVEILRVKGISKASKKMSRVANEGVVAISGDEKKISIIVYYRCFSMWRSTTTTFQLNLRNS